MPLFTGRVFSLRDLHRLRRQWRRKRQLRAVLRKLKMWLSPTKKSPGPSRHFSSL